MSSAVENSGLPDYLRGWSVPDFPDFSNTEDDESTLESKNQPEVPKESEFRPSSPVEHSTVDVKDEDKNESRTIRLRKPDHPTKTVHSLSEDSGFGEPEENALCDGIDYLVVDDISESGSCEEECEELYAITSSSHIVFQVTDSKTENGGFTVTSSGGEHIVNITDPDSIHVQHLKLKNGDKIVAVNSNHVGQYEHILLVDTLRYMFDPDVGTLTLILERSLIEDTADGCERFVEVKVIFSFPRRGDSIMDMESAVTNLSGLSLSMCKLKLKGKDRCWIECGLWAKEYLYMYAEGDILKNGPMTRFNQSKFQFYMRTFTVLQWTDIRHQEAVFICSLQTGKGKYVIVNSHTKVSLKKLKTLDRCLSTQGNPAHFIITSSYDNTCLLESVTHRGSFLACNGNYVEMKKVANRDNTFDPTLHFKMNTSRNSI